MQICIIDAGDEKNSESEDINKLLFSAIVESNWIAFVEKYYWLHDMFYGPPK